mgnify:CR=1 FL=1
MKDYIIAIPSYKRSVEITTKTLPTLKRGKVSKDKIHVFVANKTEEKVYREAMDPNTYGKIVVGRKGIVQQRRYISKHFPVGTKIVSLDDDVEKLEKLNGDKLSEVTNLDTFFKNAFKDLNQKGLNIWGVYPVENPFFMSNKVTVDLRFLIGVVHGYINRHDVSLYPNLKSKGKEDYHQTILFFLKDGGVLRYNNVTFKTKFNAPGGLGTNRFKMNDDAAKYLHETYPDLVTRTWRDNGMAEIRLRYSAEPPQQSNKSTNNKTKKNKTKKNKTKKNKTIKKKSTKNKTKKSFKWF